MRIVLDSKLHIQNPGEAVREWCENNLWVDNPEYQVRIKRGMWIGGTPPILTLYEERPDEITAPYGVWHDKNFWLATAWKSDANIAIDANFAEHEPVDYNADIPLYDYQQAAVDSLVKRKCGILQSKAGSGKTRCGIATICRLGVKSLWLTHTNELLEQSYGAAAEFVDEDMLGKITGGKVQIGRGITFATVQTMNKLDLSQYTDEWECVIVDECHRVAGTPTRTTMFSKVLNSLAARYKYGLSATLHRSDGLIKCVMYMLGGVAHTVPDSVVRVMDVKVERRNTTITTMPDAALDTDGTIVYARLINAIAQSKERNILIARDITNNNQHSNLLLSDRKSQLYEIYNLLPAALQRRTAILHGGIKKADRQNELRRARDGEITCLLATYQLAKEGLDIPRLDRLYLGTPVKDYAIVVQAVGRIARPMDGKEQPIVYDYVDGIRFLEKMYKYRLSHYKKCGCKI